jgi:hypothetical protein
MGLWAAPGTVTVTEEAFFPVATVSSTIVFHSPQAGHLPIHFGLSFPHSLQNHTLFTFAVAIIFSLKTTGLSPEQLSVQI